MVFHLDLHSILDICQQMLFNIFLKNWNKNIVTNSAKFSILIDKSTIISALCGMVCAKVAISNNDPIFIFFAILELQNQTIECIVEKLIECLNIYIVQIWMNIIYKRIRFHLWMMEQMCYWEKEKELTSGLKIPQKKLP